MRKNKLFIVSAVTAAFMMMITACGAPANETAATTASQTETTSAEAESKETSKAAESTKDSESAKDSESSDGAESSSAASEAPSIKSEIADAALETTTAAPMGSSNSAGKFTATSGKFEITIPSGWTTEPDSDETLTTFTSTDGNDYIEISHETGDIANIMDRLPKTAEEYMNMISKGDDSLEILTYQVTDGADGKSQTFQYAIKDNAADTDAKYTYVSGSYDPAAGEYICATAIASTSGDAIIKTIDAAMKSFKILK